MADIVFISPNMKESVSSESIGTVLLTSILRSQGLQADILQFYRFGDLNDFQSFLDKAVEMILGEQPKIVSFYTRCDNYHIMLKIAERLRGNGEFYIVFGGPQADISAVDTLREIPYVDFVCCGEGETTVYPLFSSLLNGTPDLSVPGLVYRREGEVVQNPRPKLIENLDDLPEMDYSAFRFKVDAERGFSIDVGRGCPFGCIYCSTKTFWGRKYRLKSPQRIVREIRNLHEQFGVSRFIFEHDMFTMNRAMVIETCRLIKDLGFPITWTCSARIDCIDKDLIDIMKDAGLDAIYFGIESGSPRMQKLINKNLKLDGVPDMLSYIRSQNIRMTTSFIYGFPEETEEDVSHSIALIAEIAKLGIKRIQTHLCTFLPGTELTEKYKAQMTATTNYSDITGNFAMEECADLVEAHPNLFGHFREYHSDIRTKLQYFSIFIKVWITVQPVYQYLSEKYPQDRLIDMYYDFVKANQESLDRTKDLELYDQVAQILENDRFAKQFENDERSDIIADFYRILLLKKSDRLKEEGSSVTDIFCFSPGEMERSSRLQEYERKLSVAIFTKEKDGNIKIQIHGRR